VITVVGLGSFHKQREMLVTMHRLASDYRLLTVLLKQSWRFVDSMSSSRAPGLGLQPTQQQVDHDRDGNGHELSNTNDLRRQGEFEC
jgi:hypothetical protein